MKLVDAMTMMIQSHVELESGHQCMLLVNDIQNHNEMKEKAGSVNGTDVESTRRTSVGRRGIVCQQVCGESEKQEESRVERNLGKNEVQDHRLENEGRTNQMEIGGMDREKYVVIETDQGTKTMEMITD